MVQGPPGPLGPRAASRRPLTPPSLPSFSSHRPERTPVSTAVTPTPHHPSDPPTHNVRGLRVVSRAPRQACGAENPTDVTPLWRAVWTPGCCRSQLLLGAARPSTP